jgi:uncharacterized protein involved in tolerance to divalent cations
VVSVVIYLKKNGFAEPLAKQLVASGLVASASIDVDNYHFVKEVDEVIKTVQTVITLQSKAMLFSEIEQFVEDFCREKVPIYTTPIAQTDQRFHQFILENTTKI